MPRRDKSLNDCGNYVEVWCVPSAAHMSWIKRSSNKFHDTIAFATSFPFCSSFLYVHPKVYENMYIRIPRMLVGVYMYVCLRMAKNRSIAFKGDPSKAFPRNPDPSVNCLSIVLSLTLSLTHTHTHTKTHLPAHQQGVMHKLRALFFKLGIAPLQVTCRPIPLLPPSIIICL